MDTDALAHLFTYHPPTDETRPKYVAIAQAMSACLSAIEAMIPQADGAKDLQPIFQAITGATHEFAKVINTQAPDSADKSAAIRCVRLARMAANEVVLLIATQTSDDRPTSEAEKGFAQAAQLGALCENELIKARWQANAAIACG